MQLKNRPVKVDGVYRRSVPAAVVEGLHGVAAHASEMFMMSEQIDGVFAEPTLARHYGEVVEVDWAFPWPKNHYTGCHCAWTHSAADISDTYGWKPRRS